MNRDNFRLTFVEVLPDSRLRLRFGDGVETTVDLSRWISETPLFAPLADAAFFASAHPSEGGWSVIWIDDELELGADNLRNLATEQAGGIGHERIWEWMHRNGLTQERAAEAIGISRRMLNYYLACAKPIPKTIWLACLGFEAQQRLGRRPLKTAAGSPKAAHA